MNKIASILLFAFYFICAPFVFVNCGGDDLPYSRLSNEEDSGDVGDPLADESALCDCAGILIASCVETCQDEAAGDDTGDTGEEDTDDTDGDGILDDGDLDGTTTNAPCTGGATATCDDNCPNDSNADQADTDSDGVGDVCDTV